MTAKIVSEAEWIAARKELLIKEKEMSRAQDAVAAQLRQLPMVKVAKEYTFTTASGTPVTLRNLFGDKKQLIVYHFMLAPGEAEGCKGCSFLAEHFADPRLLATKDTAFTAVSRAPIADIEAYRARTGWRFPWVSSHGSEFNYDFQATLDDAHGTYNFRTRAEAEALGKRAPGNGDMPGLTVFYREGENVYRTYSAYARGLDRFANTFQFLDVTPLGRQEGPAGPGDYKRNYEYDAED